MPIETRGIWEAVPMTNGRGYWVQSAERTAGFDDDLVVCLVEGRRPNDARMIAAAPELHDALDELLNAVEQGDVMAGHEAIGMARAALAKSRNTTPF